MPWFETHIHCILCTQEKVAFIDWINLSLQHDQYLRSVSAVPVKEDGLAIFSALKDGILMRYWQLFNHLDSHLGDVK